MDILRVFNRVGRQFMAECVRASRRAGGLERLLFTKEEIGSGVTNWDTALTLPLEGTA